MTQLRIAIVACVVGFGMVASAQPRPMLGFLILGSREELAANAQEVCWQPDWGTAQARRCMPFTVLVDILAATGTHQPGFEKPSTDDGLIQVQR